MAFELPELPFDKNAFEGWTSAETFDYHHGKHHAGYTKKLNAAIEGSEFEGKDIFEVIAASRATDPIVFNNAAQYYNHSFFWSCLSPEGGKPEGRIADLIDRDLGGFEKFKEDFSRAALTHFGSGWVWLVQDEDGSLSIAEFHDADTPADTPMQELLTLDVWEHAYYIDFRNDRGKFIDGFWNYVNWEFVDANLK